jgi:hypothetical protein
MELEILSPIDKVVFDDILKKGKSECGLKIRLCKRQDFLEQITRK